MRGLIIAAAALAAVFSAAPAWAHDLVFTAQLSGHADPTNTGSEATGTATFQVNTHTQLIDARIEIHGLKLDALSTHLAHSRMGPMHLHRYQGNDVTLIVPFPFGETYTETADGFVVTVTHFPYAEAAERTGSHLTFEEFLAALASDPIYLNVHTNRFPEGEIAGRVISGG